MSEFVPMNILFVCGSMKMGADGIGDYTRRLACELVRNGHKASVLAFSDRHIDTPINERQSSEGQEIEVLRVPAHLSDTEKFHSLEKFIKLVNPDWISVQYVLYAYNKKGLPFKFASSLKSICKGRKFEIMFHELWLGMEKYPLFKDKIYGFFQSRIIQNMMSKLKPQMVHTHSRAYQTLLAHYNINAVYLPIFSNIPVIHELHNKVDLSKKEKLSFLLFGHISEGAPVELFAKELSNWCKTTGKYAEFIFAGRNGDAIMEWQNALKSNGIPYMHKGVLSTEELSDLMADSDIGIATTPILLYEKSGSVAAMIKHGLPVLNIAVEWVPEIDIHFDYIDNITEYKVGQLKDWLNVVKKNEPYMNLSVVSQQFIQDLRGGQAAHV